MKAHYCNYRAPKGQSQVCSYNGVGIVKEYMKFD